MVTLKHSYALNSAVALSLNTLHSSLSRYIYVCRNLCVLIAMVSEMGGQLNSAWHSSTTVCDLTQKILILMQGRSYIWDNRGGRLGCFQDCCLSESNYSKLWMFWKLVAVI